MIHSYKEKMRIYDLVKDLVPTTLSEKDKKNLQAKKTKQIIDLCTKLGYANKTPSSSLEVSLISKVLPLLEQDKSDYSPEDYKKANTTQRKPKETVSMSPSAPITEPAKKSRVLRRIMPEINLAETHYVEAEELHELSEGEHEEIPFHPSTKDEYIQHEINSTLKETKIEIETSEVKTSNTTEIHDSKIQIEITSETPEADLIDIKAVLSEPLPEEIIHKTIHSQSIEISESVEIIDEITQPSEIKQNLEIEPKAEPEASIIQTVEATPIKPPAPIEEEKPKTKPATTLPTKSITPQTISTQPKSVIYREREYIPSTNSQANSDSRTRAGGGQGKVFSSNSSNLAEAKPNYRPGSQAFSSQNPGNRPPYQNRPQGTPGAARPGTPPGQTTAPGQGQPFRVAKPVNNSFNPNRRKAGAGVALRKGGPATKPGAPGSRSGSSAKDRNAQTKSETPEELVLTHPVTVKELSALLVVQDTEIIRKLFMKGIMRTVNQTLEFDLIQQIGQDLGCTITIDETKTDKHDEDLSSRLKGLVDTHVLNNNDLDLLEKRPPVVTIMGHVDHGKTTLLDAIRKSKKQITDSESGGITQHIGAYQIDVVDYDGHTRKVTFLDTPGHEAFTALRARGAQVTDIAILVVAADDGVMPQTIEAISHAKAAEVPIIIAVNKIDKPDASTDRILTQLIEHGLVVEEYGGNVVSSKISAKQRLNLEDLLTKITLVADTELESKLLANPTSSAVGAVIEASLSSNRGSVASLLVQSGTLRKGDAIAAGTAFGRVRAMFDDSGIEILEAPPSTPVQVLGLDSLPQAGDTFQGFKNSQAARAFAMEEREKAASRRRSSSRGLEVFSSQVRDGTAKELAVIIKADVQGSAEAIAQELNKLSGDQAHVRIVHSAAGAVTENDVNLASATNAVIVNFNASVDSASLKAAAENNVPIYNYNIIYQITDAVTKALNGLLEPERIEILHGSAEIRQIFPVGKNKVAGCSVIKGKIVRGSTAKIMRGSKLITTVRLVNLKRFKDDAKEVQEGFECGISFDGFNDIQELDIIESWGEEFRERTI
ncbi:MAG: translation initiation factor IF-2 [Candidatus Melainabacteria bacterium]|jgi:translation initiation factor IF-2